MSASIGAQSHQSTPIVTINLQHGPDWVTKALMPAKKPSAKSTHRAGGRPPKGDSAALHTLSIRFTESDWARLEGLVSDQQAKVAPLGVTSYSAADMVRLLVRQEAERRGLDFAAAS